MQIKGLRVAVTGGAGFIGSHLVDQLIRAQNRVVVVDNFATGQEENLQDHLDSLSCQIIRGDVRDPHLLERAFEGVDVVFHLATHCVRLSLVDPKTNHDVNATGTLNALMAAKKCGVKRFIYCSSSEVFGNSATKTSKGKKSLILKESSPKLPTTIYGASKLVGENYALAYHQTYGLPSMVVRPFNAYGPRSHSAGPYGEVIPRFAILTRASKQPIIFGNGKQTRDFTYVEDTAAGLIAAAECDKLLGDSINIARGEEVSILQISKLLCKLHRVKHDPKFIAERMGDIHRLGADIKKAKQLLKLKKGISIEEGVKRYLAWLDKQNLNYTDLANQMLEQNWKAAA